MSKSELRRKIRKLRNNYTDDEILEFSTRLEQTIFDQGFIEKRLSIASFLSFDGEIGTQPINRRIVTTTGQCYLPKLKPTKPNRLWFMPFHGNSVMKVNKFGIPEVNLSVNHAIAVSQLDIVLLPLVAFDGSGNRLGMGGGFYDATFAHLKDSKKRPKFIGLAYESQKVAEIPTDPWDIRLDGVCTEQRFYDFSK